MKTGIQLSDQVTVELIDARADDVDVLEAMLVSTSPELAQEMHTSDPSASQGRIKFLMKNRHGTPFEHTHFKWFVSAPIFVFREFHRHRIGFSYNEQSGRYSVMPGKFWIPQQDRPLVQTGKPGAYEFIAGDHAQYLRTLEHLTAAYKEAWFRYEEMLTDGVAKEVARACLPVALFSSMYVTCNARSLMSFLSLRIDDPQSTFASKPMKEIEQVARIMEEDFKTLMPITSQAFHEYGRVSP